MADLFDTIELPETTELPAKRRTIFHQLAEQAPPERGPTLANVEALVAQEEPEPPPLPRAYVPPMFKGGPAGPRAFQPPPTMAEITEPQPAPARGDEGLLPWLGRAGEGIHEFIQRFTPPPPEKPPTIQALEAVTDRIADNIMLGQQGAASGLLHLLSNIPGLIRRASDKLSQATGLPSGQAAGVIEDALKQWSKQLAPSAADIQSHDSLVDMLTQAASAAPLAIAQYGLAAEALGPVAGFAVLDALRESDKGLVNTLIGGVKGAVMGKALQLLQPLQMAVRAPATGTLFAGAQEAERALQPTVEGQEPLSTEQRLKQDLVAFLTGAGLTMFGGRRPPGPRQPTPDELLQAAYDIYAAEGRAGLAGRGMPAEQINLLETVLRGRTDVRAETPPQRMLPEAPPEFGRPPSVETPPEHPPPVTSPPPTPVGAPPPGTAMPGTATPRTPHDHAVLNAIGSTPSETFVIARGQRFRVPSGNYGLFGRSIGAEIQLADSTGIDTALIDRVEDAQGKVLYERPAAVPAPEAPPGVSGAAQPELGRKSRGGIYVGRVYKTLMEARGYAQIFDQVRADAGLPSLEVRPVAGGFQAIDTAAEQPMQPSRTAQQFATTARPEPMPGEVLPALPPHPPQLGLPAFPGVPQPESFLPYEEGYQEWLKSQGVAPTALPPGPEPRALPGRAPQAAFPTPQALPYRRGLPPHRPIPMRPPATPMPPSGEQPPMMLAEDVTPAVASMPPSGELPPTMPEPIGHQRPEPPIDLPRDVSFLRGRGFSIPSDPRRAGAIEAVEVIHRLEGLLDAGSLPSEEQPIAKRLLDAYRGDIAWRLAEGQTFQEIIETRTLLETLSEEIAGPAPRPTRGRVIKPEVRAIEPPASPEEAPAAALPAVSGKVTAIQRADTRTPDQAGYAVVEANTLLPSHNAFSFSPNTRYGYPEGVQTRTYDRDPSEQQKVMMNEKDYDPSFTVNTDNTSVGGPPIVTSYAGSAGPIVVGGNSRVMTLQRLYAHGRGEVYTRYLLEHAKEFGLNPDEITALHAPVLVRMLEGGETWDLPALQKATRAYNMPFTQEQTAGASGVAAARQLSAETLDTLDMALARQGEDVTLREFLKTGDALGFIRGLEADGILTPSTRNRYINSTTGLPTPDGITFIEQTLIGRVFEDVNLLEAAPAAIKQKVEKSLPQIIATGTHGEWDLRSPMQEAILLLTRAKAAGMPLAMFQEQGSLLEEEPPSPKAVTLAEFLDSHTPTAIRTAFTQYLTHANADVREQAMLPGMPEPPKPADAFGQIFGAQPPAQAPAAPAVSPPAETPAQAESEKDLQSFIAEARRLSDEVGDTAQMNTGALIDAFRRAKGDVNAASQLYFGMKDDAAPSIARTLTEFKEKTARLASLYHQQYNLAPKAEIPEQPEAQPLSEWRSLRDADPEEVTGVPFEDTVFRAGRKFVDPEVGEFWARSEEEARWYVTGAGWTVEKRVHLDRPLVVRTKDDALAALGGQDLARRASDENWINSQKDRAIAPLARARGFDGIIYLADEAMISGAPTETLTVLDAAKWERPEDAPSYAKGGPTERHEQLGRPGEPAAPQLPSEAPLAAKGLTRTGVVEYGELPKGAEWERRVYLPNGVPGRIVGEDAKSFYISRAAGSTAFIHQYPKTYVEAIQRYYTVGSTVQTPKGPVTITTAPHYGDGGFRVGIRYGNGEEQNVSSAFLTDLPKQGEPTPQAPPTMPVPSPEPSVTPPTMTPDHPWQMTPDQFTASLTREIEEIKRRAAQRAGTPDPNAPANRNASQDFFTELQRRWEASDLQWTDAWNPAQRHREIVQRALAAGRPVPAEVKASYPDLTPTPEPTGALTPTGRYRVETAGPGGWVVLRWDGVRVAGSRLYPSQAEAEQFAEGLNREAETAGVLQPDLSELRRQLEANVKIIEGVKRTRPDQLGTSPAVTEAYRTIERNAQQLVAGGYDEGLRPILLRVMDEYNTNRLLGTPQPSVPQPPATVNVNTERGGVEIKFTEKPSSETTARLKAAGFKWSGRQGLWYANYTPSREAFARMIARGEPLSPYFKDTITPEQPPTMPTTEPPKRPYFREGDLVTGKNEKGEEVSGKVIDTLMNGSVRVQTDQMLSEGKPVSIWRQETILPENLRQGGFKPTEHPVDEIDGPVFKEGDRVQWTDDKGQTLTGTVRSQGAEEVSIKTDSTARAGGVPIGRSDRVSPEKLTKLESPTPPTMPPSVSTPVPPPRRYTVVRAPDLEWQIMDPDGNPVPGARYSHEGNAKRTATNLEGLDESGLLTAEKLPKILHSFTEPMKSPAGGIDWRPDDPATTPPTLPEPTTGMPPTSLEAQVRDLDGQISDLSRDIGSVHDNITRLLQNRNQAVRDGQSSAATGLTERLADEQVRLNRMQDELRTLGATHAQLVGQLLQRGGRGAVLPEQKPTSPTTPTEPSTGPTFTLPETAPSTEPPALPGEQSQELALWVRNEVARGQPITSQSLFAAADDAFGGTQAQGRYTPKDAYDAMEMGVNLYAPNSPTGSLEQAKADVTELKDIIGRLPTQTKRTQEQEEFQQFSTPPPYAYTAAWVANITPADTVLEPSAGVGGLAIFAKNAGARTIVNELSPRRRALLEQMGFDQVFGENAEQLNNILPKDVQPTVVLMNPPFSATAGRLEGARSTKFAEAHLEQALKRLVPDGRLVAIVGRGMADNAPSFQDWWKRIKAQYNVRANIGIDRKEYAKYGTSFGNQLIVIDKTGPTPEGWPITDFVKTGRPDRFGVYSGKTGTIEEALSLLEGVRNDRVPVRDRPSESAADQPTRPGAAPTRRPAARPDTPVPPPADAVGTGERGGQAPRAPTLAPGDQPGSAGGGRPQGSAAVSLGAERGGPAERAGDLGGAGSRSAGGSPVGDVVSPTPTSPTAGVTGEPPAPSSSIYEAYTPRKVHIPGAKPHPGKLVESAAMASVDAPDPTYTMALPPEITSSGKPSSAQLESVVYAGQAHEVLLPDGTRQGWAEGSGTGFGKGIAIAAIIRDNEYQGRQKAVWVSVNDRALPDSQDYYKAVGGDPKRLFLLKGSADDPIRINQGVLFTTYGTLRSGSRNVKPSSERKKGFWVPGDIVFTPPAVAPAGMTEEDFRANPQTHWEILSSVKSTQGAYEYQAKNVATGQVRSISQAATVSPAIRLAEIGNAGKTRIQQIVDWLGEDFDGVIAFDESHLMGNAIAQQGSRGTRQSSRQAAAGLELQKRLPNARILYVSATMATEVSNLAYAPRLGLWGQGTAFPDVNTFVNEISAKGVAAMELVARDLKAMGKYMARNLSFDDVTYETLVHELTPQQLQDYDVLAGAWRMVMQNMNQALTTTGGMQSGGAKSAAYSAFWGAELRFFNQVLTSMQMPAVLERIKAMVADPNGDAAVIQLVNTNEATQNRRLAEMEEMTQEDLEGIDLSPMENLMQYVKHSFPTTQYETYFDDNGNPQSRPVLDSQGNRVENADAVAMRERLLDQLGALHVVPEGPLEILLNTFGPDNVAEVTGRSRRVVRMKDAEGNETGTEIQSLSRAKTLADVKAFMDDKKRILVFSDAGGTAASYHADLDKPNQRHREHFVIQPGWRADRTTQSMGRDHRTNEASAPNYILVTTNLKAQKRFISSIARRLDQLGALTKGERRTGGQGLFSAKDNLESPQAVDAMTRFWRDLYNGRVEDLDFSTVTDQMGLDLLDNRTGGLKSNLPPVTQFLNRLMVMDIETQNQVFDAFFARVEQNVAQAIANGTLDIGLETVRAQKTEVVTEQTVYTDPRSGAETKYVHLSLMYPQEIRPWAEVGYLASSSRLYSAAFFLNERSGRVWLLRDAGTRTLDTGQVVQRYLSESVTSQRFLDQAEKDRLTPLSVEEAKPLWEKAIQDTPTTYTEDAHLITGLILPIWDRLPKGHNRAMRVQTDDGRKMLGLFIDPKELKATLRNLGASAAKPTITPADAVQKIADDGYTLKLANGWTIKRSRVSGEWRIEIIGPNYNDLEILQKEGAFTERIQWDTRVFIPTGADGARALEAMTQYRPIVEVVPPTRSAADVLAQHKAQDVQD